VPRNASRLREERRRQLAAAARKVFASKGYHACSVDDIIAEAGVARGTFYNYFDSKRDAFGQVLQELFALVWGSIRPILTGPDDDIPAQVERNLRSLIEVLDGHPDLVRVLFSEAVGLDPEGDEALARFYRQSRERLARALRLGQSLGIVAAGDADLLAVSMMGMLKEYWFQSLLGAELVPPEVFLRQMYGLLEGGALTL
jgi:AcrR family transcriptional regulator